MDADFDQIMAQRLNKNDNMPESFQPTR